VAQGAANANAANAVTIWGMNAIVGRQDLREADDEGQYGDA
jgi:hypothetical protein